MVVSATCFRVGKLSRSAPSGPREGRRGRDVTIVRTLSLAATLFLFWLALSGHYSTFLIAAGAIAALVVALLGIRAGYGDEEGHPVDYLVHGLAYWPWLIVEIAKSAWAVARIIVDPKLPISPRLIRTKATQRTAVGIATYANSITLTPGTITVEVSRREQAFLVHALTRDSAAGVEEGSMDRRVSDFEGQR